MLRDVYLTKAAKLLPNGPVSNDEMEDVLGRVGGKPSRARRIILKQNGIHTRYYVLTKSGHISHNNARLTTAAIQGLLDESFTLKDIQLLCCGTTSPDQLAPSHASMVHGELKCPPVEVISTSGVCGSGMQALKHGFLSVRTGETQNAVCTGSETSSLALQARHYEKELEVLEQLEKTPILAFEKDFLRWMLSDAAGAVLLESRRRTGTCLKVEWIDGQSFANELETCMYSGCVKDESGAVRGWKEFSPQQILEQGLLMGRQDVRVLDKYVIDYAVNAQAQTMEKRSLAAESIDWFLPHLSSEYFRLRFYERLKERGIHIPLERWFTNLQKVGNVGSASAFLMLEELMHSGKLKPGQKVVLVVPESSRFTYYGALFTVC
jgi:3-oxoacyl-[acyl-carrier-protein] synthase-3